MSPGQPGARKTKTMRLTNKAITNELFIAFPKLTFDVFGNSGSGTRCIEIILTADENGEVDCDDDANDIAKVWPRGKSVAIDGKTYPAPTARLVAFAVAQYSNLRNR